MANNERANNNWASFEPRPNELNTLLRQAFLSNPLECEVGERVGLYMAALKSAMAKESLFIITNRGLIAKVLSREGDELAIFYIGGDAFALKALVLDITMLIADSWNSTVEIRKLIEDDIATRTCKGGGKNSTGSLQRGWWPKMVFRAARGRDRGYEIPARIGQEHTQQEGNNGARQEGLAG